MPPAAFDYARIPPIHFGAGKLSRLPLLINDLGGRRVLVVTGSRSLRMAGHLYKLDAALKQADLEVFFATCDGEPSASRIDEICDEFRSFAIDVVVGIGGGSAVDAGKAVSAMLPHGNSIFDHLEGVGKGIPHSGIKTSYIAVPTTSGTGSEVTKNAVISKVGPDGYKKSIRHDNLVPDRVIVDGKLLTDCPPDISAACGMDAFTQLMEPYLSPRLSPISEALIWSGFRAIKENLLRACGEGAKNVDVREGMAFASLVSGIALANDGLGIVHGLASPIGGRFAIPHGVICGTLMAPASRVNLKAMRERSPGDPALAKMARLGELIVDDTDRTDAFYCDALVDRLYAWTDLLSIPKLGAYGMTGSDLESVVKKAANRNNPVELSREEIREIVEERL